VGRVLPLAAGMFALGLDAYVLAGVLPDIAGDLHAQVGSAGLMVTAFTLAYALLSPVLATLTASWNRRWVLLGALGLFTLANVGSALAPTLAVLMVTRVIAGIGAGLYAPTAAATAAALAGADRRGRALALVAGGLQTATVIGVPIGALIGSHLGWRATMTLVAVIGAATAVLLTFALSRVEAPAPPPLRQRAALLTEWPILRWLAVMTLASIASLGLYTYLGPILATTAGIGTASLPVYLLVWGASLVAGNVAISQLLDRGRRARILLAGVFALLTVGACLLSVAVTSTVAVLVLIVFGLACGSGQVPLQHNLLDIAGSRGPIAISLLSSALYLGSAIGSALGGLALTVSSPRILPLFAGAAGLLALLLSSQWRRRPAESPDYAASGATNQP
jgi:predicted MFS family arabinose efflux permease